MRVCLFCVLPMAILSMASASAPSVKSALELDPKGWVDLLGTKDLKNWKRVPVPPDEKLNPKNPWSLAPDGRTLLCDGVGVKEMLLHERARGDGIFHVEWRFHKLAAKRGYNSGVYVRTAADGKIWHQAQVAHLDKPPLLGDLFGETLVDSQVKHFQVLGQGAKLARPPGEWNTYEITCKGKTVTVRVNGNVATTWDDCQVPRGHIGLQAEFFVIAFRNLKFKELP
jgi:3-keto-disaccharide hydrolase